MPQMTVQTRQIRRNRGTRSQSSSHVVAAGRTQRRVPGSKTRRAVVNKVPPPTGIVDEPLKGLIFDSMYDIYRGVIIFVRLLNGSITKGSKMKLMSSKVFEVEEIGVFKPKMEKTESLAAGEVGYIAANVKEVRDAKVGDTITDEVRSYRRGAARLQGCFAHGLLRALSGEFGGL